MTVRLDKFISSHTEITRSEIKKLISKKAVTLNGETVCDSSLKIDPESCTVCISGKPVDSRDKVYYLLNKPAGYISATYDKKEKTVTELLCEDHRRKDIFPAGRLDKDSTGMLILTNDGALSHKILSPASHIPKFYIVKLAERFRDEYVKEFEKGVVIDGGEKCLPAKVRAFETVENTALTEISQGKFHQVKRMFEAVGNKVEFLHRVQMGALMMPVELGFGSYIEIMHKDLSHLLDKPDFGAVFEKINENLSSYSINI